MFKSIKKVGVYAWAGLGASFGPIVIMSVYWRDMTRNGAIAGMVTGGLTVIIWPLVTSGSIYELLPGFFFAIAAIIIVSKVGPKPSQEITDEFDEMLKMLNEK